MPGLCHHDAGFFCVCDNWYNCGHLGWSSSGCIYPRRPNCQLYLRGKYNTNVSHSISLTFKASRCIKASYYIPENRFIFLTTKGFRVKISMKMAYQYIAIFFNFSTTSNHLHPLQVENCDSNSRLVVDEDDNGKFRVERVIIMLLPGEYLAGKSTKSCSIAS